MSRIHESIFFIRAFVAKSMDISRPFINEDATFAAGDNSMDRLKENVDFFKGVLGEGIDLEKTIAKAQKKFRET